MQLLSEFAFTSLTSKITGSKKQSDEERGASLFAVRVNFACYAHSSSRLILYGYRKLGNGI